MRALAEVVRWVAAIAAATLLVTIMLPFVIVFLIFVFADLLT